jgi:hypothetical protein
MKNLKNIISCLILITVFNANSQNLNIDWSDNGNSTVQKYSNSENPFDTAGKKHNILVSEFLKINNSKKLSVEETISLANDFCDAKELDGGRLTMVQFNYGIKDIKNNFRGVVERLDISKMGKFKLQELFNFMVQNGTKGNISIEEVTSYIVSFENSVLKNNSLNKKDKEVILSSTSVARFSTGFWYNYNSADTTGQAKRTPGWLRWLIVGAADVAGGVAGGGAFSVATGTAASLGANQLVSTVDKEK